MTLLSPQEQILEQEILERERKAIEPPLPPRRSRFVRWVEWMGGLVVLALVVAVTLILVLDSDVAEEVVPIDEAQSELAIGPRHLDPAFAIPQHGVGENLDATLEEELAGFEVAARPFQIPVFELPSGERIVIGEIPMFELPSGEMMMIDESAL